MEIYGKAGVPMVSSTIPMLVVQALTVFFISVFLRRRAPLIYLIAGEICQEWQSWGDYFNVQSILGHSLLQASIYVVLSVRNCAVIIVVNSNKFAFELDRFCWKCCTVGCNIRTPVRNIPSKVIGCD